MIPFAELDTVPTLVAPDLPKWRWLPGAQRYYNFDTHRIISAKQVREWAWQSVTASRDEAKVLAADLAEQRLTVGDWEKLMRQGIKDEYIRQYVLGRGGLDQMTKADWGSVGGMLADQYRYLDNFAAEIGAGNLSEGQIAARAQMYYNSAQEGFWRATERAMGLPPLPDFPGSGNTICLTNCKCFWEVTPIYQGRGKGRRLLGWRCFWRLRPADHCDDDAVDDKGRPRGCLQRAALWNPLELWMPGQEQKGVADIDSDTSFDSHALVTLADTLDAVKGGPGSGNFGHAGRPGKVGGSAPGSGRAAPAADSYRPFDTWQEADEWITINRDYVGKIVHAEDLFDEQYMQVAATLRDIHDHTYSSQFLEGDPPVGGSIVIDMSYGSKYISDEPPQSQEFWESIQLNPNEQVVRSRAALERMLAPFTKADTEDPVFFTPVERAAFERMKMELRGVDTGRYEILPQSLYLFPPDQRMRATLMHEYGHKVGFSIDRQYADQTSTEAEESGNPLSRMRSKEDWRDLYGVTSRAKDNFLECIAENFVLYATGHKKLVHPDMQLVFGGETTW